MRIALILAAALITLAAYVVAEPLFLPNTQKALIIDGWWQRDFGINACDARLGDCSKETVAQAEYTYSGELMAQLSANKDCSGVVVHYFSKPDASDTETARLEDSPHMTLMVDYAPYRHTLGWSTSTSRHGSLAPGVANLPYQSGVGNGTPKEIAEKVCAIVANPGAWK